MLKALLLLYLRRARRLTSCSRVIDFAVRRYKNQTFIIQPQTNLTLTFEEFGERIEELANRLNKEGFKKGDVFAYSSLNCAEYFETRAACHKLGVIFLGLPVNLSEEEKKYFIDVSKSKKRDCPRFLGTVPFFCTFNLSSGTTQKTPKVIKLTDKNWIESLFNYVYNSDFKPNQKIIFLCSVPLITAGSTTFLPSILAGATQIIVNEDLNPQSLVNYITGYRVNRLYITPSRLLELLEYCKANDKHLESLENIVIGTERIPAIRLQEAVNFFGPIITVGYGMAEALPPIALLSPKDYNKKRDSVGKIVSGVRVKILEDGRIAIKSKTVSEGYLDNPDENSRRFKGGWFYSDDYGFVDKDGYLYILGRKEEILVKEPKLIFAKEIEDKVYEIPFINRCSAMSKNSRIVIFVSLRGEVPKIEEVKKRVLEKIGESALEVIIKESLPINASGKLDRRRLSEEIGY